MMTGAPPRIPVGCGAFVSFHPSLGSVAAYELGGHHVIARLKQPHQYAVNRCHSRSESESPLAIFQIRNDPLPDFDSRVAVT